MTFIAEDGTGLSNANSLCDVAFADTYFADRSITAWSSKALALKQSALISATDYVEARWSAKFAGEKQFTDDPAQALSFPRLCIDYDGVVPDAIKKAVAEYAVRWSPSKALAPDPIVDASGFVATSKRTKVGPIETETSFSTGSTTPTLFKPYPAADMLVRPFLRSAGGSPLLRN